MSDENKSDEGQSEERSEKWGLLIPFWIDTDGYSKRDREMFTAGYEFCMIVDAVERGDKVQRVIHRENESRVRMLCGKFNRRCTITPHEGYDGCETWSDVTIEAKAI